MFANCSQNGRGEKGDKGRCKMQQSYRILKIFDEMGRFDAFALFFSCLSLVYPSKRSKANKLFLRDEQEIGVKGVSLQLSKL